MGPSQGGAGSQEGNAVGACLAGTPSLFMALSTVSFTCRFVMLRNREADQENPSWNKVLFPNRLNPLITFHTACCMNLLLSTMLGF